MRRMILANVRRVSQRGPSGKLPASFPSQPIASTGEHMPASKKKPVAKAAAAPAPRGYRDILYEVKDQVAWITINRPRVLNAFREHTLDELIDALKSTREDPAIVCAVVTGAGDKAFSAGGDFYAM